MSSPTVLQPPELSIEEVTALVAEVRDLQISRGSVVKIRPPRESANVVSSPTTHPVGISLFPTAFPRRCFDQASTVQRVYHELYAAAVRDVEWLETVLRPLIAIDEYAALLWKVHESVGRGQGSVEGQELGIWRGDYMLNVEKDGAIGLKMVEMNTISCAGGAHSEITTSIHRQFCLHGKSRHHAIAGRPTNGVDCILVSSDNAKVADAYVNRLAASMPTFLDPMPANNTIKGIAYALQSAMLLFNNFFEKDYNIDRPPKVARCVLIIVQPKSLNAADEVPIEDALWNMDPVRVPAFRVELTKVLAQTELGRDGQLLFKPLLSATQYEAAVVYFRAGHAILPPARDGGASFETRVRIEQSRAIKCPSILAQMCTFKIVQRALTRPEALSRLLKGDEGKIRAIQDTQVKMYTLNETDGHIIAHKILTGDESTADWVLKHGVAEGGGNNVFDDQLTLALQAIQNPVQYVLMQRLKPPGGIKNYLALGNGQVYGGDVVSELGILGACMFSKDFWRSEVAGWSFKSKRPEVNEMSVIKGFGSFDTPYLVDDKDFIFREA